MEKKNKISNNGHTHEHSHEVGFAGRAIHGDITHSHIHPNEINVHHGWWDEPKKTEDSPEDLGRRCNA